MPTLEPYPTGKGSGERVRAKGSGIMRNKRGVEADLSWELGVRLRNGLSRTNKALWTVKYVQTIGPMIFF